MQKRKTLALGDVCFFLFVVKAHREDTSLNTTFGVCVYVCVHTLRYVFLLAWQERAGQRKEKNSWYWKHLDFYMRLASLESSALFLQLANKFNTFY